MQTVSSNSGLLRATEQTAIFCNQSGGGSMLGGIGSTIAQGMDFGTGSAVAHRAVDAVMGPRTIQHETVASEAAAAAPASTANTFGGDACGIHSKAFQDVMYEEASQVANDAVSSIRIVASFCAESKVMDIYGKNQLHLPSH